MSMDTDPLVAIKLRDNLKEQTDAIYHSTSNNFGKSKWFYICEYILAILIIVLLFAFVVSLSVLIAILPISTITSASNKFIGTLENIDNAIPIFTSATLSINASLPMVVRTVDQVDEVIGKVNDVLLPQINATIPELREALNEIKGTNLRINASIPQIVQTFKNIDAILPTLNETLLALLAFFK